MAGRRVRGKRVAPTEAGRRLQQHRVTGRNGRIGPARTIQAAGGEGARADTLTASAETALRLLDDIRQHRLDPSDLTTQQRRSCLLLMANGTQTSAEMAAVLRVSPSTIRTDLQHIRAEVGRMVRDYSIEEVIGQLALASEKCTAQAMKQEDPALAWTIQRDFAKLLKEFGVVQPAQEQNALRVTIEAIGEGYERAREALGRALDPRLTGEETIDVAGRVLPALPLEQRVGDDVAADFDPAVLDPDPGADLDPDA